MSDSEQPTVSDQPEEQQPAESQPAETEEQPTGTGEDTQETPAEETPPVETAPEATTEETPETDEGEAKPSGEETEGEPKPAEEGEQSEQPSPAEEGEGEQAEPEPEPEVIEEPVVITPEGNPLWLSTEDVLAKGLPESEVENFKNFYFRQTHCLQAWYEQLKEHAYQTEFITLSKEESPTHTRHKLRKAKAETLDNQILRAFVRSTTALLRVKSGKEAIELLRRSARIRNDLNQLKAFDGVEGVQVSLSVCRWQEGVAGYPGMEFRGFVYQNELNGLSQYNETAYYPNTDVYFNTIQAKVQEFFNANVKEALRELENYIIDFYVTPEKVLVVRLNPFYTAIGACLFTWAVNGKVLTQGPFEFRIVETPRTAPEAFSSFQQFWQTMLDSVLQQRRPRQSKCTLL